MASEPRGRDRSPCPSAGRRPAARRGPSRRPRSAPRSLGDVFNFDPDVHMQSGGLSRIGLTGGDSGPGHRRHRRPLRSQEARPHLPAAEQAATRRVSLRRRPIGVGHPQLRGRGMSSRATRRSPRTSWPDHSRGSLVSARALGSATWGAPPVGTGQIMTAHLPAPWTGGTSTTVSMAIYLPPGYDASKARYPVLYEAPATLASWQAGMAFTNTMDALITSGKLPHEIVVFVSEWQGGRTPTRSVRTHPTERSGSTASWPRTSSAGSIRTCALPPRLRRGPPSASRRAAIALPRSWLATPTCSARRSR